MQGAQQVALVDTDILQDDIAGGIADDAHLLLRLTAGNTGQLHINNEHRDAFAALLGRVGLGINDCVIRERCARDKGLAAIQNVIVTVFHSSSQGAACIRASARLCQTKDEDLLALGYRDQVLLLLLFGAAVQQRTRAQGV